MKILTWQETGLQFTSTKGNRKFTRAIVLHWTNGEGGGEQVFRTLTSRNLGIHFAIDRSGVIYQYADANVRLVHAGYSNDWSIGIEIVNIGTGKAHSKFPREQYEETIHGVKFKALRFYEEQMVAAKALVEALCAAYSLPLVVPGDESGAIIKGLVDRSAMTTYKGILGHYHLSRNKTDPGTEILQYITQGNTVPIKPDTSTQLVAKNSPIGLDEQDDSDRLI